jgi:hypothetical protein
VQVRDRGLGGGLSGVFLRWHCWLFLGHDGGGGVFLALVGPAVRRSDHGGQRLSDSPRTARLFLVALHPSLWIGISADCARNWSDAFLHVQRRVHLHADRTGHCGRVGRVRVSPGAARRSVSSRSRRGTTITWMRGFFSPSYRTILGSA